MLEDVGIQFPLVGGIVRQQRAAEAHQLHVQAIFLFRHLFGDFRHVLFSNLCVEKLFVFFVALRVGLDNAALRFADEPDESVAFGTLRNLFFDLLTAVQVVQAALEEDAAGVVNL